MPEQLDMLKETEPESGGAVISDCGLYRYSLWRRLAESLEPVVTWILLNPSTADAKTNDATLTRVIRFSAKWGFGKLNVVNLYALRSTDPIKIRLAEDPVGPENDEAIKSCVSEAQRIVCGWGTYGSCTTRRSKREQAVRSILEDARQNTDVMVGHLGLTLHGCPGHPLYLRTTTPFEEYLT